MKIDLSKIFIFCPKCGIKELKVNSKDKHITCQKCGFEYYHNVASAAGAIIEYGNKVLVIARANEPKKGLLDFPGGFANYGESIERCLKREIKEELGIKVNGLKYLMSAPNLYQYKDVTYATTDMFFTCRTDDIKKIKTDKKEVASIKIVNPKKIPFENLAFDSGKKAIKYYIKVKLKRRSRGRWVSP